MRSSVRGSCLLAISVLALLSSARRGAEARSPDAGAPGASGGTPASETSPARAPLLREERESSPHQALLRVLPAYSWRLVGDGSSTAAQHLARRWLLVRDDGSAAAAQHLARRSSRREELHLHFDGGVLAVTGACPNPHRLGYRLGATGRLQSVPLDAPGDDLPPSLARPVATLLIACNPDSFRQGAMGLLLEALAEGAEVRLNGPEALPPGAGDRPVLTIVTPTRFLSFVGEEDVEARYGPAIRQFLEIAPQRVPCARETGCLKVREHVPRGLPGPPVEATWHVLEQEIAGYRHHPGIDAVLRVKRFRPYDRPVHASEPVLALDLVLEVSPPRQAHLYLEVAPQRVACDDGERKRCLRVREVSPAPSSAMLGLFHPDEADPSGARRRRWIIEGPWRTLAGGIDLTSFVPGRRQVLYVEVWSARDAAEFIVYPLTRLLRVEEEDLGPDAVAAAPPPQPLPVVERPPSCQGSPCLIQVP